MKAGDKLYTGAIVTAQQAETYNALTAQIEKRVAAGMNTDNLDNGRHNYFCAIAGTREDDDGAGVDEHNPDHIERQYLAQSLRPNTDNFRMEG